jgi:hypothetical protein
MEKELCSLRGIFFKLVAIAVTVIGLFPVKHVFLGAQQYCN